MLKAFAGSTALVILTLLVNAASAAEQVPTSARKIVLEKAQTGYRWKLIEAPVQQPGSRQVLVRVRAVGLNRGDWEMLARSNSSGALIGRIPGSDAAGDIVAVGRDVKGFRPGMRVTSLYFRNWTDGAASKKIIDAAHGVDVDGVIGEYIVLEDTAVVQAPKSLSYEEAATLPTAGLTAWNATIGSARGVYVGSRVDYQRMGAFIDEHRLHPVIDKVFPLDQFDAALQHLRDSNSIGRVVLTP